MRISAHLDVDVVAVETDDEISVLVELTAPPAPATEETQPRPVRTLQVVLDRSGSMRGDRLNGAITALQAVVDRLDPTDNFGVVAFDNTVMLPVPAGPLTSKADVRRAIGAITAGGNTNLSAGYLRGIQEARRVAGPAGATLLLISDGHANDGVTDLDALGGIAAQAHAQAVSTTTLGFGLGYDERLMSAIAHGGAGNELFAEESDTAVALISGEVEGLLSLTVQAASLLIRGASPVRRVRVLNELPVATTGDDVLVELGSFYADEPRRLLLVFEVPALAALGLAEVASLEFTYVELPALVQHTVTVPLYVNVVPADVAAGRVPDPTVRAEAMYQSVQQAKRRVSRHLSEGNVDAAMADLRDAQSTVRAAMSADLAAPMLAELATEAQSLEQLSGWTMSGSVSYAAKFSSMDAYYKSGRRGRAAPTPSSHQPPPSAPEPNPPAQEPNPPTQEP
jgi:Ca-activated chloride channel family protein